MLRRVLPKLTRHWRVIALVRHRDAELAAHGITQVLGDLDQPATLGRLAGIADAVIHSAPPPDHGDADPRTRRLIAALRKGSLPRSLVYISTSGVYGDCRGDVVPETHPLRPATARAQRRQNAEDMLRAFAAESGCRVVILRAPGIYALDRLPLERLRQGLPVLQADADIYTNHIHAGDLAGACLAALRAGRINRSYNVCDDSALLMADWYDRLADRFQLPRPPRMAKNEAKERLSAMQWSFMQESRRLNESVCC